MKKVSWGILSTAKIGREKVIPALQKGNYSQVDAIASRNIENAEKVAIELGIPKAYGSYEELLEDSEIESIYIPLPNHLHVGWTIKSLEAGKHVLCEKPIALNYDQAIYLQKEVKKFPELKVMEAFMYRFHPQWQTVKKLVDEGTLGDIKNIYSIFSYFNDDPTNVRNQAEIGGGGLLDIGCYCISLSRYLYGKEPVRVCGTIEYDPEMKIDRLTSGILEFENGTSSFTCSTQLVPQRRVIIYGTQGSIEMTTPFIPSPQTASKIIHQVGSDSKEIIFDACDQYTIQGDLFSQAILNNLNVPTPLEDGIANMKVIDKIFESNKRESWIKI